MGVSAIKYLGYVVNLKRDLEHEDYNVLGDFTDRYPVYSQWRHERHKEDQNDTDRVTLVVDGMSGRFARLVYVLKYKDYIYPEVDDDDYTRLHSEDTPIKVIEELQEAYKLLYGVDLDDINKIEYARFYLWG